MIFIELDKNLNKNEKERIKQILVLHGLIETDDYWMIDNQQYKLAINQILKEFANIDVSKLAKRDIRVISMKNDAQPPKWFKIWSETIYENRQPRWFKDWSEKRFDPLVKDVSDIKIRVSNLEVRVTKLEDNVEKIFEILNEHSNILKLHSDIFIRNNLK